MSNDQVIAIFGIFHAAAGLGVITDGEQTRFDFNLSFYGYIQGIELESASPRRFGPIGPRPTRQTPSRRNPQRLGQQYRVLRNGEGIDL